MNTIRCEFGQLSLDGVEVHEWEHPPMIGLEEYRRKRGTDPQEGIREPTG